MRPGQSFYGGMTTNGGSYIGVTSLKQALVAAGLPRQVPAGGAGLSAAALGGIAAPAALLLVGAAVAYRRRRRRQHP